MYKKIMFSIWTRGMLGVVCESWWLCTQSLYEVSVDTGQVKCFAIGKLWQWVTLTQFPSRRNLSSTELIRFFTMLAFFISFFVSIGATAIYFSFSSSILFPFLNNSLTLISFIGTSTYSSFSFSFINKFFYLWVTIIS